MYPCSYQVSDSDSFDREELFYQLSLRQFGDYPRLKLEPPPSIRELVRLAVESEDGIEAAGLQSETVIDVRLMYDLASSLIRIPVDCQNSCLEKGYAQ